MTCPEFAADARGDVHRGLQVVETAAGITSNLLGDHMEGMLTKDLTSPLAEHLQ